MAWLERFCWALLVSGLILYSSWVPLFTSEKLLVIHKEQVERDSVQQELDIHANILNKLATRVLSLERDEDGESG